MLKRVLVLLMCLMLVTAGACAEAKSERYDRALSLYRGEEYYEARELFRALGSYKQSSSYLYKCEMKILPAEYKQAEKLLKVGDYADAKALFEGLGTYSDSRKRAQEAQEAILAQEKAQAEAQCYEQGIELLKQGKWVAALDAFVEAGAAEGATEKLYEVLAQLHIEPGYRFTTEQLKGDRTSEKSAIFTAPDGSEHYYQIFKGVPKWVQAKAFCETLGGHLATLTTPEEDAFVHKFMIDSGYLTAYFGLSDEERTSDWIWVTGEPFDYCNWHDGEPSQSPRERYGMYFYKHTDGTWNDSHFYEHDKDDPGCSFICEWDVD